MGTGYRNTWTWKQRHSGSFPNVFCFNAPPSTWKKIALTFGVETKDLWYPLLTDKHLQKGVQADCTKAEDKYFRNHEGGRNTCCLCCTWRREERGWYCWRKNKRLDRVLEKVKQASPTMTRLESSRRSFHQSPTLQVINPVKGVWHLGLVKEDTTLLGSSLPSLHITPELDLRLRAMIK